MSNTNPSYNNILTNLMSAMNHSSSSLMSTSADNSTMFGSGRPQPLLQGYLHKLHKMKTKKQKYFVIFEDCPDNPGRLEYFDTEKKFRTTLLKANNNDIVNTKRSIILRSCFNINRRMDTKYKFVIGLYRKDDCFSIILKDEEELNKWLKMLLVVQRGKELLDGDQPRPTFEHVWEVSVIRRGLGESYGILGNYRLCITDTTLSLVRIGPPTTSTGERRVEHVEFALASMRRCGATHGFFYLEVGRFSTTGAGEIWMETGDQVIAENMNTIILGTAAKRNKEDNLAPMMRIRSQSANESSKPMMHRRATVTGPKPINFSPAEHSKQCVQQSDSSFSATSTCTVVLSSCLPKTNDSLSNVPEIPSPTPLISCDIAMISETPDDVVMSSEPSVVSMDSSTNNLPIAEHSSISNNSQNYANLLPNQDQIQQSQPSTSTLLISTSSSKHASSTTASSNVSMVCHQRALSLPSASPMLNTNNYQNTNLNFINNNAHHIAQPSIGTAASSRERCDSFPSIGRTRTISETSSEPPQPNQPQAIHNLNNNMPPPSKIPGRTQSMYNHRYNSSQSPPVNSSPLSPPSGAYSTEESGGSSISIDEVDGFGRTPEEHNGFNYNGASLSLPYIQSQGNPRRGSPNPPINTNEPYMEMCPYSPCSSSPGDAMGNNYMPMSPGVDFRAHSRASSLTEDNDGYVPMQPTAIHEEMLARIQNAADEINRVQSNSHLTKIMNADMSSATSSCSITSGTPSTDIRFSEYHLEKVTACFTPSEDDDQLDRPLRTYSVGSKLECNSIRKPQIDRIANEHTNTRVRAFSVGSRAVKVTRVELTSRSGNHTPSHNSPTAMHQYQRQEINNNVSSNNAKGKKSSSVPALTNGGVNRTGGSGSFDHMDDLMEIDFSSSRSIESVTRVNNTPIKNSLPVNIPSKSDDYMNMTGRSASKNSSVSGYVEMKPGRVQTLSECNDYMDMKPGKNSSSRYSNASSLSSSPVKTSSNPRTVPLQSSQSHQQSQHREQQQSSSNYMDMSPRNYEHNNRRMTQTNRMTSSISSLSSAKAPSDDYLNMSPVSKSILHVKLPKEVDGYMEMSWNNNNNNNKSNNKNKKSNETENPSSSSDEYINMDYSNNNDAGSTSSQSSSGKDRSMSRPITIQNQMTSSLSPTQLTINHNRTRYDSRDSGIVTPSSESQPTIFPFSPGSPSLKQFVDSQEQRKCFVDVSSDILMTSRPPSVSDRSELHYASLDLPQSSNTNPIQTKMDIDDLKMDLSSSPSSNAASSSSSSASSQQSQQPVFSYAQIDFVQSESLKAANQHQQQ
ncbi:unnamed protein product [Diamesa hyperborea]